MMWPTDYDAEAGHEPCERCGAHKDCGEDCIAAFVAYQEELEARAYRRAQIHKYYVAARLCIAFARSYRAEEGRGGQREREALAQAQSYRISARELRSGETTAIAAE